MTGDYNAAQNSKDSYDLAIKTIREKLEAAERAKAKARAVDEVRT